MADARWDVGISVAKTLLLWPAVAVGAFFAVPALAQVAVALEAHKADTGCEFHVWPGSDLRSTYSGWLHGGIVDGAVNGREGYSLLPKNPFPASKQVDELRQMPPLADLMGIPGYRTIIHDEPLESRVIRSSTSRYLSGASDCYAELAIDDVFFQEDIVTGKYIKVLFRFRKYNGSVVTRSFGSYIQCKLLIFPPKMPSMTQASLDELAAAFRQAAYSFAEALKRPIEKQIQRKR